MTTIWRRWLLRAGDLPTRPDQGASPADPEAGGAASGHGNEQELIILDK